MTSYRVRERLHDDLVQDLLLSRGISPEAHAEFLAPDFERDGHDPFLLPDMEKAVERVRTAKERGEKVAVWSDYDCDGIPGGAMLSEFLALWGLDVVQYIPHRHKEGYGLNEEGLSELARAGAALVITVDLGSSDVAAVAHAKDLGMDTIVTDHHLTPAPLPDAFALINPKRPGSKYPFDGLCGAGVAWKLVQALLLRDRAGIGEGQEKWLLDLVGLATLSDMVPLVGENRMLAWAGLRVLRRARRPGLSALLKLLRISPASLTEDDVAFMIAPRINAASRMDTPQLAARLLSAKSPEEGAELAQELNRVNDERKGVVASITREANKRLEGMAPSPVIVMGSPAWRPGVLGLVAGTLAEAHQKPVFLWGREGGEELRGSARSEGSTNVVELMGAARELFVHYGGHAASGGFALEEAQVHELLPRLSEAHASLGSASSPQETVVDRELPLAEIPHAFSSLRALAPFGVGNEKPLFIFRGVRIAGVRAFGKQQNHLGLSLEEGSARVEGIAFFSTPESFTKKATPGERADIAGHVEADWRGRPRVRVVDIL